MGREGKEATDREGALEMTLRCSFCPLLCKHVEIHREPLFWKEPWINCDVRLPLDKFWASRSFLPTAFQSITLTASSTSRAGTCSESRSRGALTQECHRAGTYTQPRLPSATYHPRLRGGPGHGDAPRGPSWRSYERCGLSQHRARGAN